MKRAAGRASAATTIDSYLAALDVEQREALQRLRVLVHAAAPGAQECISYGLPAMRHGGRMLLWVGAATHHCAFYPGAVVEQFADELARFETSKGTIRFQPAQPLPAALVKRIVKACVARGGARSVATRTTRKPAAPARRARPRASAAG
jgi:uncharacterized protein YdhG (YjbR/CyaY superfamily)